MQRFSFQGTLAQIYVEIMALGVEGASKAYLLGVVEAGKKPGSGILAIERDGVIIVGLKAEQGLFAPDW